MNKKLKYQDVFPRIEQSMQETWKLNFSYQEKRKNYYCLAMMPYPSGNLHVGHVRNYTISDAIARRKILEGYNVLHPMGWDAFGLPAEKAALERNIAPHDWTQHNIAIMKKQMSQLGMILSWNRELTTSHKEYYFLQQKFFLELYKAGVVKRQKGLVYWDPVDKTVLAREQVIDGKGWRSHAPVERKVIDEWVIDVAPYAESLYDDLSGLCWPKALINSQRAWIGKRKGYYIDLEHNITLFTTKPQHLPYATYIALGVEHPLVLNIQKDQTRVRNFVARWTQVTAARKELPCAGVKLPLEVRNPLTQAMMPVYCSNKVDSTFGSGAIMGCPLTCEVDRDFAQALNIPSQTTLSCHDCVDIRSYSYVRKGTAFRLRNWSISRQRYWGCPIPIIQCAQCGDVPSHEPVPLQPFNQQQDRITTCPLCHRTSRRDPDTLDTFFESSWYYAKFASPSSEVFLDSEVKQLLPVDCYIGGIEHATLHFLYARLFYRLFKQFHYIDRDAYREPFRKIIVQGMIYKDGCKMSKSKGNVVDPTTIIEKFGADSMRLFILGKAPIAKSLEWSDKDIVGYSRLLSKIFDLICCHSVDCSNMPTPDSWKILVNDVIDQFQYDSLNNVVSSYFKLFYVLAQGYNENMIRDYLLLLYPIAPHLASYAWSEKFNSTIEESRFPTYYTDLTTPDHISIPVFINNKYRRHIEITPDVLSEEIEHIPEIINLIAGRPVMKIHFVPTKVINIILRDEPACSA